MITIYFTSIEKRLSPSAFLRLLAFLPEEMRMKTIKFRRQEDAHSYLLGKLLLKRGLADLGFDDDLSKVKLDVYNRPFLNYAIDFNISHSGDYVLCVFSKVGRIGIDIEKVDKIELNDFRSQWNDNEWFEIINSPQMYQKFYTFWTIKEAVIKADGRGLGIPLKNLTIKEENVDCEGMPWRIKQTYIDDNYVCHVAFEDSGVELEIQKIHVQY